MKRAIKIIVPLLLSIAILLSIGWYLFEYDPDFTRDMLLAQARSLESAGNHSAAVWFYELAYMQAQDNDQVAIELAQQFKAIGNYTKAEYTLSNAIQDGGSVELYVALCQTFVEQNKLLDAVQMLEKVNNKSIKAELDRLRPQTPTASTPSGFYSEYLTISLEATGTLYCSTDGEYPSVYEDAYKQPVSLPQGETTIWAISVGENGLVSPPAVFSYTIGNVIEEVSFADAAMEAAIRQQLGLSEERVLYSNELWNIKEFTVPLEALSCKDLAWLPNLEKLTIRGNAIDSLDSLKNLVDLETIIISNSVVSAKDLLTIASLPALRSLTLSGCSLSNITNLAQAVHLEYLDLEDNTLRDISVLANMPKLRELYLGHNALISLDALSGLSWLEVLDVSYNSLVTTAPVSALTGLTKLDVSGNGLMKLDGIEALTGLKEFSAAHNKLIDVDVLSGCKDLEKLDISNNTLLNIDIIADLVKLLELNFANNEIFRLPDFKKECNLVSINGSHNQISTMQPLGALSELRFVYMDYNAGITTVYTLTPCLKLEIVNVYGTGVRNVSVLTDRGVVVNYNPV